MDQCISAGRAWSLLRTQQQLTPDEKKHVATCSDCLDFLEPFTNLAKAAGLTISLDLSESETDSEARRKTA